MVPAKQNRVTLQGKAELWQCLTCSRIPRLAGGNPPCNDTLRVRYNKQQVRVTHRGSSGPDKLLDFQQFARAREKLS